MAECSTNPRENQDVTSTVDTRLPIFSDFKTAKYHKLTDFIIGEVFRKFAVNNGWTPNDLTNPAKAQLLTKAIYTYYQNMLIENAQEKPGSIFLNMSDEAYLDIESNLIPNFEQFIGHYYKFSPIAQKKDFELDEDFFEKDYSEQINSEEDATGVSDDEQEDADGKEGKHDKQGSEQSPMELADDEVKILFRLMPKGIWNESTKNVDLFFDADGLPTTADVGPVFNLLLNTIANTKDWNQLVDRITSVDTLRIVPEAKYLGELLKLDKPGEAMSRAEALLSVKFYQLFSKPKVQIQTALSQDNGNFILIDQISGNINSIKQQFTSNFQMGDVPETMKQYLSKDELQGYSISKEKIPPKPITRQARLDFLGLLGIKFSGLAFLDSTEKQESFDNLLADTIDAYIYPSMVERLNAGQILRDPVNEMRKAFSASVFTEEGREEFTGNVIKSEATSMDKLIEFESRYSRLTPSLSARNADGELQYLISLDNQLTTAVYHLNNAKTLDELYNTSAFGNARYNPLFKTSYTISFLFDQNGNKIEGRTIDISNLSGYKKQQHKRTISKLERKLSSKDKLIQDFRMMLTEGKTDTIRTETSHSFFSISMKDKERNKVYFPLNSFLTDFKSNPVFRKTIHGYLVGEIARVKSYTKKKEENPSLPDSYKDFTIFYETMQNIPATMKEELLAAGNNLDIDAPLFRNFMAAYEQELNREGAAFKANMNQLGISMKDLVSSNIRSDTKNKEVDDNSLIRAFIAGTQVQNIEFTIMFSGDPLFFENKKGASEFHKRTKGLSSTGDLASIINLLDNFRNSPYEKNFHDKYSIAGAMGQSYRNNNKTFQTQTLVEYKQGPEFAYTKPVMVDSIYESLIKRDGKSRWTKEQLRDEVLAGKFSQKPADGEGYISLDFHRELSYRFGFNTEDMETAYKYEGLVYRADILGETFTDEEKNEYVELERKIFANPEKYAIPVIKMTYWGGIANTTVAANAYDKFSTAPLLPSDVKNNPKLLKLLQDMTTKQVGYVKYQSATKLFATTPVEMDNIMDATHDQYYTELLKLQIKPKSLQKGTTAIPTQMLKLIFSNLFSNGVPTSDRVKELYEKYVGTLKGIQKVQTAALLEELGMDKGKLDINKLSNRLITQAKAQGLNSNVIAALQVKEGALAGVLEESGFVKQIVDMVSGIADKKLRRFKIAGGDFVLVSNANRSPLNFYKYNPDGLTEPTECRITLTKEYAKLLKRTHPDGNPIGTLSRLNRLLNNKAWVAQHQKELTVVLDRVPTQGPNSMDFAIVKEFLSPTMGNVVIMPDEIVYKSGTDFDYDKEKVLTPTFNEDGIYYSDENDAVMQEKVNKIREEYRELLDLADQYEADNEWTNDPDSVNNFITKVFGDPLLDFTKGIQETQEEISEKLRQYFHFRNADFNKSSNEIVDTYTQILSQPEMFAELVMPNSTDTIKPLAEQNGRTIGKSVELPSKNRVFSYLENLNIKNTYFDAKTMLGPYAVDNTFVQLMQYQGINLNDSYFRYGNDGKKHAGEPKERRIQDRKITNLLLSGEELAKIKDGNSYKTSLKEDLDGYLKQHWDSETINATVDAAKDPWFALLRINYQNIGVVNLMKNLGYPMDRIIDFVNQPVLQKYFELQQNGMSKLDAIKEMAKILDISTTSTKSNSMEEKGYKSKLKDPNVKIISAEKLKTGKYLVNFEEKKPITGWAIYGALKSIDEGVASNKDIKTLIDKMSFASITKEKLHDQVTKGTLEGSDYNLRIFAHFVMMDQHNQAFRNFQYYFNYDTTKSSTPTDVRDKQNLRQMLLDEGLYKPQDIENMENNSIMSAFINNETMKKVFDSLFPIIGRNDVQDTLDKLYQSYKKNFFLRNQRDLRNMPKVLNSDFVTAILFNFNKEDDKSFIERNKHLILREAGKRTMADRLDALKKQPFYRNLATQFPVLDNLIVNKHRITHTIDLNGLRQFSVIDNIQMVKPISETSVEEESTIEQLRTLQNYKIKGFDKATNKTYTEALQKFMKDLFTTGLLQSGMDKTFIGFSEYIPYEFKRDTFKNAMDNFKKISPEEFSNFLVKFSSQFTYNNPKYFPSIRDAEDKVYSNDNNYSSRFKLYDNRLSYTVNSEYDSESDSETQDEPKGEPIIVPITSITRENVQKEFTITEKDGKTTKMNGYRIKVKEYPEFKAYIIGNSKTGFSVMLPNGRTIDVVNATIKDILPEIESILNGWAQDEKNLPRLQKAGLFVIQPSDGSTPINPKC